MVWRQSISHIGPALVSHSHCNLFVINHMFCLHRCTAKGMSMEGKIDLYDKQTSLAACAWASQVQALSSSFLSCSWHRVRLSEWALPIKCWRHCSFSTPLDSTRRSPGSTFKDQLWWSCFLSHRASIMEQTTSNNPVTRFTAAFQDSTESSLFLMDRSFFLHSSRMRAPLNVTPCFGA